MGYGIIEEETIKSIEEIAGELIEDQNLWECYNINKEDFVDFIEIYRGYLHASSISKDTVFSIIKKLLALCEDSCRKQYKKISVILLYKIMTISCVRKTIKNTMGSFVDVSNRKVDGLIEEDEEFGRYIEGFFNKF